MILHFLMYLDLHRLLREYRLALCQASVDRLRSSQRAMMTLTGSWSILSDTNHHRNTLANSHIKWLPLPSDPVILLKQRLLCNTIQIAHLKALCLAVLRELIRQAVRNHSAAYTRHPRREILPTLHLVYLSQILHLSFHRAHRTRTPRHFQDQVTSYLLSQRTPAMDNRWQTSAIPISHMAEQGPMPVRVLRPAIFQILREVGLSVHITTGRTMQVWLQAAWAQIEGLEKHAKAS